MRFWNAPQYTIHRSSYIFPRPFPHRGNWVHTSTKLIMTQLTTIVTSSTTMYNKILMMTSSNVNIFRVIGHLWGNSPVTHKGQWRGALMFFFLRLNKRLRKQSWCWWFETLSRPLWRHCNVLEISNFRSCYPIMIDDGEMLILTMEVWNKAPFTSHSCTSYLRFYFKSRACATPLKFT